MKPIYCLHVHQYDYCQNYDSYILHTTNKKQLEDLAVKLEKRYGTKDTLSFDVQLVEIHNNVPPEHINRELKYLGVL